RRRRPKLDIIIALTFPKGMYPKKISKSKHMQTTKLLPIWSIKMAREKKVRAAKKEKKEKRAATPEQSRAAGGGGGCASTHHKNDLDICCCGVIVLLMDWSWKKMSFKLMYYRQYPIKAAIF
ncbi:unnamed protein product, partial [Heterosigma akashiwo]